MEGAGCFTWADLETQRKELGLPKGYSLPEIINPKKDGTDKGSTSLNLKSVEMMHFVCHR
jgi:hypothetical protein